MQFKLFKIKKIVDYIANEKEEKLKKKRQEKKTISSPERQGNNELLLLKYMIRIMVGFISINISL